jgi:hypothetical protein
MREAQMHRDNGTLVTVPAFDRLTYFYGQLLGARDFQVEQAYFREKLKLHNRCLHGYGVVCGLRVTAEEPPADCPPSNDEERRRLEQQLYDLRQRATEAQAQHDEEKLKDLEAAITALEQELSKVEQPRPAHPAPAALVIHPGIALDCEGNELIVRDPIRVEPWRLLSLGDRRKVEGGASTLYVSVCYCEQPIEPTRPALADPCSANGTCTYGKMRDSVSVHVSAEAPRRDERCETCCGACDECCLLLATVSDFTEGGPIEQASVDTSVRREIGTSVATTITGISWSHGGSYSPDDAKEILGTNNGGGIEIRFSQPVHAEDLVDAVLQIHVTERGRGRSANIYELGGDFVDVPPDGYVDSLRYRQTTGESLQHGDLVTIVFRAPMVLDRCCRPVAGLHSGRVPLLADYERFRSGDPRHHCERPPFRAGQWTTHGDGNFESWFFIRTGTEEAR